MIAPNKYIIIFSVVFFTANSETSGAQSIRTIDRDILESINGIDNPIINGYSSVMSTSAVILSIGLPASMLIYGGYTGDNEMVHQSVTIGASVATSVLISYFLKNKFDRARPYQRYPSNIDARTTENSYSFPPSHSSVAFALATSVSMEHSQWYVIAPAYFWAASVGFSRIQMGVHYPSDVVAGAILGTGSAFFCHELNNWLFPVQKKKPDASWVNFVYER
jgi:membrane-associated phospholipid phosphatase